MMPLTATQRNLWLAEQAGGAQHLVRGLLQLSGRLNPVALWRAVARVTQRHESLRSGFVELGGDVSRVVRARVPAPLHYIDLTQRPEFLDRVLLELGAFRFDCARAPLIAMCLIAWGPQRWTLWIAAHHIIFDELSMQTLCSELTTLYEGAQVDVPAARFTDFAGWLAREQQGENGDRARVYWQRELAEVEVGPLSDAFRGLVPMSSCTIGARRSARRRLSAQQLACIDMLCQQYRCTRFVVLLGAMQLMLARQNAGRSPPVGIPVQLRPFCDDEEALIGMCINMVAIRGEALESGTLPEFFESLRQRVYAAWEHRFTPLAEVHEQPQRLLQFMFGVQAEPANRLRMLDGPLAIESRAIDNPVPGSAFTLLGRESGSGLELAVEFDERSFPVACVDSMLDLYVRLLESIAKEPGRALSRVALAPAHSTAAASAMHSRSQSVYRRFAARCAAHPGRIALHAPDPLTFLELQRHAAQVVAKLRKLGVGEGALVGLALPRNVWLVAAQLGVLAIGGGFVPISRDWPRPVLRGVCARVDVVLTGAGTDFDIPDDVRMERVDDGPLPTVESTSVPARDPAGHAIACVLYTSGSTGTPKGVALSHANLESFLEWADGALPHDASCVTVAASTETFDLSLTETLMPACLGYTTVMTAGLMHAPRHPRWHEVNCISAVTTVLRELLVSGALPEQTRFVLTGGEVLDEELASAVLQAAPHAAVFNLYGPTEITVCCTADELRAARVGREPPSIGPPLAHQDVRVVDAHLHELPSWCIGQIVTSGPCVSLGYIDHAAETAARFIPNPFAEVAGERMHLTGDLGFRTDDGRIHFVGRADQQRKLRGVRVNLEGVESVLRDHEAIADAACAVMRAGTASAYIATVLVARAGGRVTEAELRAWLTQRLPASHIPTRWVWMDRLPATPSGKIDRRRVQAELGEQDNSFVPARLDPMQRTVWSAWNDILGEAPSDIDTNFFDAGGNSLLAPRLSESLRRLGVEVSLKDLFRYSTIRQQARLLASSIPQGRPAARRDRMDERAAHIRRALRERAS